MKSSTSFWNSSQFVSSSPYTQKQTARTPQWKNILSRLVQSLVPNDEPRISQVTRNGKLIWKVYNPQTQQRLSFTSEAEVRSWLETRYYEN